MPVNGAQDDAGAFRNEPKERRRFAAHLIATVIPAHAKQFLPQAQRRPTAGATRLGADTLARHLP
jgi:hypothetical protein